MMSCTCSFSSFSARSSALACDRSCLPFAPDPCSARVDQHCRTSTNTTALSGNRKCGTGDKHSTCGTHTQEQTQHLWHTHTHTHTHKVWLCHICCAAYNTINACVITSFAHSCTRSGCVLVSSESPTRPPPPPPFPPLVRASSPPPPSPAPPMPPPISLPSFPPCAALPPCPQCGTFHHDQHCCTSRTSYNEVLSLVRCCAT